MKKHYVAEPVIKKKNNDKKKDNGIKYVREKSKQELIKEKEQKQIKTVRIQYPFWAKILLFFFLAILIYFIFEIFLPLLKFNIYIRWWNKNGGKKYNDIFSITLLAYREKFLLYYYIGSLLGGTDKTMNGDQATFIFSMITNFGKANESDTIGFLTPYNICENIAIDLDPIPKTEDDWKTLFKSWGYPDSFGSIDEVIQYIGRPENVKKWTDSKNNFLWNRYGIFNDSPFVLSWFTNSYTGLHNNEKWDPKAFSVAVGITPFNIGQALPIGGWWGYCKYGVSESNFSNLASYIYSTYTNQKDFIPKKECKDAGLGIAGSLIQGFSTGAMAGAGFVSLVATPVLPVVLGGIIVGGIQGFTSAHSANCI